MDVADKLRALEVKRRALTAFGLALTFGYFGAVIWLTASGEDRLTGLKPNEIGDFMAGTFAPVAFLWLVIGYFLQALELKQNSESLMQQSEEMKNSVGASRMNVLNQSIDAFRYELSRICHDLNMIKPDEYYFLNGEKFWRQYMDGNVNVFVNRLIGRRMLMSLDVPMASSEEEWAYVYGNYKKLASAYLSLFDKFMHDLFLLDESGVFAKVFLASPFSDARDILASGLKVLNKGQE